MELNDYDYIRDFFRDREELERFMVAFDGIRIRVKLETHKRFEAQVRLLRGVHPNEIAHELDMKVNTIRQIKHRLQDNLLYMVEEEANEERN